MTDLLLLSGGIDSSALAALIRPAAALHIDYGQVPAVGERKAATAVAHGLKLALNTLDVDCAAIGSGLLAGLPRDSVAPTEDWWPYRNQLLVTLAAAWALPRGFDSLILGAVRSDSMHADGTREFFTSIDTLLRRQEGNISVSAPALEMETKELVRRSSISDSILGWTISCHRSSSSCGQCPGCTKRARVLSELGRLL